MKTWRLVVALAGLPLVSRAQDPAPVTETPSAAIAPNTPSTSAVLPLPKIRWNPVWGREILYPSPAERLGQQGRVLVEFSISAAGDVTDMKVVASEPAGVFEKNTLWAIGASKFNVGPEWASSGGPQTRHRICMLFLLDYKPGDVRPIDPYEADGGFLQVTGHKLVPPHTRPGK